MERLDQVVDSVKALADTVAFQKNFLSTFSVAMDTLGFWFTAFEVGSAQASGWRAIEVNRTMCDALGITYGSLKGQCVSLYTQYLHSDYQADTYRDAMSMLVSGTYTYQYYNVYVNPITGEKYPLHWYIVNPLNQYGVSIARVLDTQLLDKGGLL